jgi:hypothetical protein
MPDVRFSRSRQRKEWKNEAHADWISAFEQAEDLRFDHEERFGFASVLVTCNPATGVDADPFLVDLPRAPWKLLIVTKPLGDWLTFTASEPASAGLDAEVKTVEVEDLAVELQNSRERLSVSRHRVEALTADNTFLEKRINELLFTVGKHEHYNALVCNDRDRLSRDLHHLQSRLDQHTLPLPAPAAEFESPTLAFADTWVRGKH